MKTKLNVQHEYVTLRVELDTTRLNLTTSYGGTKATARGPDIDTPILKAVFASFNRIEKTLVGTGKKFANIGDMMKGAQAEADQATDFIDFVRRLDLLKN